MSRRKGPDPAVTAAAQAVLARWLAGGKARDARHVNSGEARGGNCEDFAADVIAELGDDRAEAVDVAMFTTIGETDEPGSPFDRRLLARHWRLVRPPEGMDWDDLDALSGERGFSPGTHTWLTDGAFHYDSECPEGTDNFFELPFFQRVVASWRRECRSTPSP